MGTSYRRSTSSTPMNRLHGRNRCIFDLSGHPDEGDSRCSNLSLRSKHAVSREHTQLDFLDCNSLTPSWWAIRWWGKVLRHMGGHETLCRTAVRHIRFRVADFDAPTTSGAAVSQQYK